MDNEKKWLFGRRKTTDKSVSDMGMYELALNNCFVKDHQAYFRDFVEEVSTRDIIRQIAKTLDCAGMFDEEMHNNDAFDTMMYEWLEDGIEEKTGVLALLSELMWAKAELHAKLKCYEDADERGEIGRVPRWIPVAEKLPVEAGKREEAYCFVFVQDVQNKTNFFTTAVFYGDTQGWDLDFINECSPPFPIYVVTHWMDMNRDIPDISDTELLGVTQNGKTTLSTIIERGRIVGVKCGDEYADYFAYNNADRCVCCGDVIPEGRQVCPACEAGEQT